jgi:Family of unknown function (DUF5670)
MNLTYIIVVILLAGWALGVFGFQEGKEIHLLLAVAVIPISAIIFRSDTPKSQKKINN